MDLPEIREHIPGDRSYFSRWVELKYLAEAVPTEPGTYERGGRVVILLPVAAAALTPEGWAREHKTVEAFARAHTEPVAARERLIGTYEICCLAGVPRAFDPATDEDAVDDDQDS